MSTDESSWADLQQVCRSDLAVFGFECWIESLARNRWVPDEAATLRVLEHVGGVRGADSSAGGFAFLCGTSTR